MHHAKMSLRPGDRLICLPNLTNTTHTRLNAKDYRLSMRSFLNQLESDRVTKLCSAADSDEKLFWKLLKGQKSSSQMSAFLVNGSLITDINESGTCGLTTLKCWEPPRKVLPMIMVLPLKFLPMLRRLLMS